MKNVRHVPKMFCNLLNITQVMKNSFEVKGKENWITLKNSNHKRNRRTNEK